MIVGIDEVGRGAWAGPLLVAAAQLDEDRGYRDSKSLSAQRRQHLALQLRQSNAHIGFGWVSSSEIDRLGLSASMRLAVERSLLPWASEEPKVLIDGSVDYLKKNSEAIIKGDAIVPEISAASIVAKVARDSFMKKLHLLFPEYAFESNVGYGTKAHRDALERIGVSAHHRLSYKPVQQAYEHHQDWQQGRKVGRQAP